MSDIVQRSPKADKGRIRDAQGILRGSLASAKLSQQALASLIGCDQSSVSLMASGKRSISPRDALAIGVVLCVAREYECEKLRESEEAMAQLLEDALPYVDFEFEEAINEFLERRGRI